MKRTNVRYHMRRTKGKVVPVRQHIRSVTERQRRIQNAEKELKARYPGYTLYKSDGGKFLLYPNRGAKNYGMAFQDKISYDEALSELVSWNRRKKKLDAFDMSEILANQFNDEDKSKSLEDVIKSKQKLDMFEEYLKKKDNPLFDGPMGPKQRKKFMESVGTSVQGMSLDEMRKAIRKFKDENPEDSL